jgi:hypothetical protein
MEEMMDVFSQLRLYFAAAALAAHSNSQAGGFRQRDLRFMLGLFLNWMDATVKNSDQFIHSNQIKRYLENLVELGHARRTHAGRVPRYELTRSGLVEMVSTLMKVPVTAPIEQFFLVYFFAKTYGGRIGEMVEQKENRLPRAIRVELEALLDVNELVTQQIRYVRRELTKLDERIRETSGAAELASKMSRAGHPAVEIIQSVSSQFPYDLNSQKPMSELFHEVPASLRVWELTVANRARVGILWQPMRDYLTSYLKTLEEMHARAIAAPEAA